MTARLSQHEQGDGQPILQNPSQPKSELLYKILVIGDLGTGKTSFIKRYVHQFFSEHYRATIGVDFALKVISWDPQTVIRLQLWDIAGQERFGNMTRVYYKEAVGAFIVFDMTRMDTFAAVEKWKTDLDSKVLLPDGRPIPCVLIGNKCDSSTDSMFKSEATMESFCKDRGFAGWFFASAKDNINVDQSAKFLVQKIIGNDKWSSHGARMQCQTDGIHVHNGNGNGSGQVLDPPKDKKCSCII